MNVKIYYTENFMMKKRNEHLLALDRKTSIKKLSQFHKFCEKYRNQSETLINDNVLT